MARISAACRCRCARPASHGFWRGVWDGIFLSVFEQGEIGPDPFRHACLMGLEGMVSKHRESFYRGGRSDHWITEPAISLIGAHPSRCYPTRRCS